MRFTISLLCFVLSVFCFVACGFYLYMTITEHPGGPFIGSAIQTLILGVVFILGAVVSQIGL